MCHPASPSGRSQLPLPLQCAVLRYACRCRRAAATSAAEWAGPGLRMRAVVFSAVNQVGRPRRYKSPQTGSVSPFGGRGRRRRAGRVRARGRRHREPRAGRAAAVAPQSRRRYYGRRRDEGGVRPGGPRSGGERAVLVPAPSDSLRRTPDPVTQ